MRYNRILLICIDDLSGMYQPLFERYFNRMYRHYETSNAWTLPSHAGLLASVSLPYLYKPDAGQLKDIPQVRAQLSQLPTIASLFRHIGFRSRAITGGGFLSRHFGWGWDWDSWTSPEEGAREWNGEEMMPERNELLFLHTYYVHNWFQEQEEMTRALNSIKKRYWDSGEKDVKLTKAEVAMMREGKRIYEERAHAVARRLQWIRNMPDDALVVLTSDHAELFYEDNATMTHGNMALGSDKIFHVPLLMRTRGKQKKYIEEHYFDLSLSYLIAREMGIALGAYVQWLRPDLHAARWGWKETIVGWIPVLRKIGIAL